MVSRRPRGHQFFSVKNTKAVGNVVYHHPSRSKDCRLDHKDPYFDPYQVVMAPKNANESKIKHDLPTGGVVSHKQLPQSAQPLAVVADGLLTNRDQVKNEVLAFYCEHQMRRQQQSSIVEQMIKQVTDKYGPHLVLEMAQEVVRR